MNSVFFVQWKRNVRLKFNLHMHGSRVLVSYHRAFTEDFADEKPQHNFDYDGRIHRCILQRKYHLSVVPVPRGSYATTSELM